ncbi:MAG: hypothetical protein MRY83_11735 [Flavobacteriales bacterium]|nr:hypothetical protein [Flavobacteriales bacterium]
MNNNLDLAQKSAINWLIRASNVTQNRGFAAYYEKKPFQRGKWAKAYPETSGYLIPTLLSLAKAEKRTDLLDLAKNTLEWLLEIQLENGAYNSGLVGGSQPSIFNSGQVLIGLLAYYQEVPDWTVEQAIRKTANWLSNQTEVNGRWEKHAYVSGFDPSYYARVAWPLINAGIILEESKYLEVGQKALHFYFNRKTQQHTFKDWGFFPDQPAPTHTIAYTYRGFFECANLLGDDDMLEEIEQALIHICKFVQQKGKLPGEIDEHWNANYKYQCLTGNCQFAILLLKMYQIRARLEYLEMAKSILQPVLKSQYMGKDENRKGAIPGSSPVYGPYFRFRYPNWAAKFFLDACLLITEDENQKLYT